MDMAEVIPISAVERLRPERDDLVSRVRAIEVIDTDSYQLAGGMLKGIKALRKRIAESCDPVIEKAHETHKAACKQKRDHEAPLIEAERLLKERIGAYDEKIDRDRRLEDARLAAEARAVEETARLAEAVALEAAGEHGEAERVLSEPMIQTAPPVAAIEKPKVAGISSSVVYRAEFTDLPALVRAIASGNAPIALIQPNQSAANQMARALKGEMHFPGIRIVKDRTVSSRAD
jgi:hypothetical protein